MTTTVAVPEPPEDDWATWLSADSRKISPFKAVLEHLPAAGQVVPFSGLRAAAVYTSVLYVSTCKAGARLDDIEDEDAVTVLGGRSTPHGALHAAAMSATDCSGGASALDATRDYLRMGLAGSLKSGRTAWDDVHAYRVVPALKATLVASQVQTQQDMGAALQLLRDEASLTIDQLTNKVAPQNIAGISRSTVGRVMAGKTLCATREALVALITACGVDDTNVEVWVAAWEQARASQNPRGRRPVTAASSPDTLLVDHGEPGGKATGEGSPEPLDPGEVTADRLPDLVVVNTTRGTEGSGEDDNAGDGVDEGWDDDEVIGTVQITRGHLQTAVVLSALAGLAATSSQAPGVRKAGAAILGVAGFLALLDMLRASTTTGPRAVSAAA